MRVTVETDDLRTLSELARELSVGLSTVSMWAFRSGANGFPEPALVAGRTRLWSLPEVISWLEKHS